MGKNGEGVAAYYSLSRTEVAEGNASDKKASRPLAIVLVPHEPQLDPRVEYTTRALSKCYDVSVVSVVRDFERRALVDDGRTAGVETVRLEYQAKVARSLGHFLRLYTRHLRDSEARILVLVVLRLIAIALLVPVVSVALLAWRLLRPLGRLTVRSVLSRVRPLTRKLIRPSTAAHRVVRLSLITVEARLREFRRRASAMNSGTGPVSRHVRSVRQYLAGVRITLSTLRYILGVNQLLATYVGRSGKAPDLVYCHDLYSLQAGVALKHQFGSCLVYDSHEFYPFQYELKPYPQVIRLYEECLVPYADLYLTVSPQLAAVLEEFYGVERVRVLPNVEELPRDSSKVFSSEMSAIAGQRLKFLYQGSFAPGRGLEEFIEDWTRVDGTRVALFLRGPQNVWRDQLEALAKQRETLGGSVYFLPPVSEQDLIPAAREADVGIIPYKGDSPAYLHACPNKLSQYLHAGLALVANGIPFVKQVVEEAECGLCYDVDQPRSIAAAVERILSDQTLLAECRRNARRFAVDRYNWEVYEPQFLRWIEAAEHSSQKESEQIAAAP